MRIRDGGPSARRGAACGMVWPRRLVWIAVAAMTIMPMRAAEAADKLVVLLDWFINPNHGPLIVAQEIGAFRRAGLDVRFVQPADPTMPPRLVAAGHGDIALDYQAQLCQQVANGLPLMRIGAVIDKPLLTLVTLKSAGITSIAGLKGKRIGYNEVGGAVNLAEVDRMLSTAHLSLADVTLVNVGTALTTSLLTRRVDAVGVDRNFEYFELIDKGETPVGFDYDRFGVPPADQLIMVVNKDTVADPRYPRFLDALKEGAAYIKAHPDAAWTLFVRAYPDTDDALNRAAWNFTVRYFADDPRALDRDKYERFAQFLVAAKVIDTAPALSRYSIELK